MKVAERGMNDSDKEFWVMYIGSKDEVKHVGSIDEWLSDDDGLMRMT